MKKLLLLLLILIIGIFCISLVPAVPPLQESNIEMGLQIETPMIETHAQDRDFKFHLHAYNSSDGLLLLNESTNCTIHIYKPSNGGHLVEEEMGWDSNQVDFEYNAAAGNFSELGQYAVLFHCEHEAGYGGFLEYGFDVTSTGTKLSEEGAIIYIGMLALLAFLFIVDLIGFSLLPPGNTKGEDGNIISISSLKYLRPVALALAWGLLMAISFTASNISSLYLQADMMGTLLLAFYKIMFTLTVPALIVWFIFIFVSIFRDKETRSLIERGIPVSGKGV